MPILDILVHILQTTLTSLSPRESLDGGDIVNITLANSHMVKHNILWLLH